MKKLKFVKTRHKIEYFSNPMEKAFNGINYATFVCRLCGATSGQSVSKRVRDEWGKAPRTEYIRDCYGCTAKVHPIEFSEYMKSLR